MDHDYKTPIGAKRPHSGGYWIKTLSILNNLMVYYASCDNPSKMEDLMIEYFMKNVSISTLKNLEGLLEINLNLLKFIN